MELTLVKLTKEQLQELDDKMYETVRDECCWKNRDWTEGELELEFDGVIYIFEYYGEYEDWCTNRGDWWTEPEYDSRCSYEIRAAYFYDEDDNRVDVETGRENGYNF